MDLYYVAIFSSVLIHLNLQLIDALSLLLGKAYRHDAKFKPDPSISENFSATNEDYWHSGWSRGHMAPAGDNKCNQVM